MLPSLQSVNGDPVRSRSCFNKLVGTFTASEDKQRRCKIGRKTLMFFLHENECPNTVYPCTTQTILSRRDDMSNRRECHLWFVFRFHHQCSLVLFFSPGCHLFCFSTFSFSQFFWFLIVFC